MTSSVMTAAVTFATFLAVTATAPEASAQLGDRPNATASYGQQLAQRPPVALSDLAKALRDGGVRLTTDEIKALLLGSTYYHRRPADGAVGVTYVARDGRWRSRNTLANGQVTMTTGVVVIANNAVCFIAAGATPANPSCPSQAAKHRAVVRSGSDIRYFFLDEGNTAQVSTQVRPGNPENL